MSGEVIMSILLSGLIILTGIFFNVTMKKEFAKYTKQDSNQTNKHIGA